MKAHLLMINRFGNKELLKGNMMELKFLVLERFLRNLNFQSTKLVTLLRRKLKKQGDQSNYLLNLKSL